MSTLTELQTQREHAFNSADALLKTVERQKRAFNDTEQGIFDRNMRAVDSLDRQIAEQRPQNVNEIRSQLDRMRASTTSHPFTTRGEMSIGGARERMIPSRLSSEYVEGYADYVQSVGRRVSASLQEATNAGGGFAVPIETDAGIVPLQPTDCALRRLASVRTTDRDILLPQFATFGTPLNSPVTEGSSFTENDPTLSQFKLSAYMVGSQRQVSLELAQDRKTFVEEIAELDCAPDQLMYEEQLYVSGTGSGEPQGLVGNVGSGITAEPDSNGNLVSIAGIESLISSLKAAYLSNASFLMSRATGLIIRAAQLVGGSGTTAFVPAWTREDGKNLLFGYGVEFSDAMPSAARGNTPVLFGDFRRGYVIGDRGGSALMVKVLDQTMGLNGIMLVIAFRRTDGRVRRAEALQQYSIAAS